MTDLLDYEQYDNKTLSGVPRSVKLTEQAFRECLFSGETVDVPVNSLMLNKDKDMVRIAMTKRGLSDACTKVFIAEDKVTCTPLKKDGSFV